MFIFYLFLFIILFYLFIFIQSIFLASVIIHSRNFLHDAALAPLNKKPLPCRFSENAFHRDEREKHQTVGQFQTVLL